MKIKDKALYIVIFVNSIFLQCKHKKMYDISNKQEKSEVEKKLDSLDFAKSLTPPQFAVGESSWENNKVSLLIVSSVATADFFQLTICDSTENSCDIKKINNSSFIFANYTSGSYILKVRQCKRLRSNIDQIDCGEFTTKNTAIINTLTEDQKKYFQKLYDLQQDTQIISQLIHKKIVDILSTYDSSTIENDPILKKSFETALIGPDDVADMLNSQPFMEQFNSISKVSGIEENLDNNATTKEIGTDADPEDKTVRSVSTQTNFHQTTPTIIQIVGSVAVIVAFGGYAGFYALEKHLNPAIDSLYEGFKNGKSILIGKDDLKKTPQSIMTLKTKIENDEDIEKFFSNSLDSNTYDRLEADQKNTYAAMLKKLRGLPNDIANKDAANLATYLGTADGKNSLINFLQRTKNKAKSLIESRATTAEHGQITLSNEDLKSFFAIDNIRVMHKDFLIYQTQSALQEKYDILNIDSKYKDLDAALQTDIKTRIIKNKELNDLKQTKSNLEYIMKELENFKLEKSIFSSNTSNMYTKIKLPAIETKQEVKNKVENDTKANVQDIFMQVIKHRINSQKEEIDRLNFEIEKHKILKQDKEVQNKERLKENFESAMEKLNTYLSLFGASKDISKEQFDEVKGLFNKYSEYIDDNIGKTNKFLDDYTEEKMASSAREIEKIRLEAPESDNIDTIKKNKQELEDKIKSIKKEQLDIKNFYILEDDSKLQEFIKNREKNLTEILDNSFREALSDSLEKINASLKSPIQKISQIIDDPTLTKELSIKAHGSLSFLGYYYGEKDINKMLTPIATTLSERLHNLELLEATERSALVQKTIAAIKTKLVSEIESQRIIQSYNIRDLSVHAPYSSIENFNAGIKTKLSEGKKASAILGVLGVIAVTAAAFIPSLQLIEKTNKIQDDETLQRYNQRLYINLKTQKILFYPDTY